MQIDPETKRCLLCVRIPFETIIETTLKLYKDPKTAYEIAEECSNIIKEIYTKKPYYLCGRKPSGLLAGLIYYVMVKKFTRQLKTEYYISTIWINPPHPSQTKIAKQLGMSEGAVTLRNNYKHIQDYYARAREKRKIHAL